MNAIETAEPTPASERHWPARHHRPRAAPGPAVLALWDYLK